MPGRTPRALFIAAVLLGIGCASGDGGGLDVDSLFSLASLPGPKPLKYRQFSSRARREPDDLVRQDVEANMDFNNFLYVCGDRPPLFVEGSRLACAGDAEPRGYHLARGDGVQGYISRIWFTTFTPPTSEVMRIYLDTLDEPAIEVRLSALTGGKGDPGPFTAPLAGQTSGAFASNVPIGFKSSYHVVWDGLNSVNLYYYHVDVQERIEPDGDRFTGPLASAADHVNALGSTPQAGRRDIVHVFDSSSPALDLDGPGTLESLEFVTEKAPAEDARLEIYWDGSTEPAVNVPLGAFFGGGLGLAEFDARLLSARREDGGWVLSSHFPMPFRKFARLVLDMPDDSSATLRARLDPGEPRKDAMYFHARSSVEEAPAAAAQNFTPLDHAGASGAYVGTILYMEGSGGGEGLFGSPLGFLEGDEFIYVDGEASVRGTGTEDYLNGGFYFINGPFATPFAGLIAKDDAAGRVAAYRLHVFGDAIQFRDALRFHLEFGPPDPSLAKRYASVAFYYLSRP